MTISYRTLAAGIALGALPLVASATEALIDFELAGLVVNSPVGAAYSSTSAAATFSGETDSKVVANLDSMDPALNGQRAYLTSTSAASATFRVDFDSAASQFDTLQLLYLGALKITIFDTNGASRSVDLLPGLGFVTSSAVTLDATQYGLIDAIEFTTDPNSLFKEFAVDNIQLRLVRTLTPIPGVPEPASYGLAALALLGVAAGSRMRRR